MNSNAVRIIKLADNPDWIPIIAGWHWDEWGQYDPEGSLESWTRGVARRANRARIPMTFVAVLKHEPVGTAVLVKNDMTTRLELSPWLAGVYVQPDFRGRGIASALVRRAETAAKEMGVRVLYLYTRSAQNLYIKLGWVAREQCDYQGRDVTIMSRKLSPE